MSCMYDWNKDSNRYYQDRLIRRLGERFERHHGTFLRLNATEQRRAIIHIILHCIVQPLGIHLLKYRGAHCSQLYEGTHVAMREHLCSSYRAESHLRLVVVVDGGLSRLHVLHFLLLLHHHLQAALTAVQRVEVEDHLVLGDFPTFQLCGWSGSSEVRRSKPFSLSWNGCTHRNFIFHHSMLSRMQSITLINQE